VKQRSEDKAGLVIVFMALCFQQATLDFANNFSSTAQTNLLKHFDTYGFYRSKSILQMIAEGQLEDAKEKKDKERIEKLVSLVLFPMKVIRKRRR
jgi:hypothetical protein